MYVITGLIFKGERLQSIGKGILVPSMIYKVIYSPKQNKAAVYLAHNALGNEHQIISVSELEKISSIDFFSKNEDGAKSSHACSSRTQTIKHHKKLS